MQSSSQKQALAHTTVTHATGFHQHTSSLLTSPLLYGDALIFMSAKALLLTATDIGAPFSPWTAL
jgi:hypothetical protein